MKADRAMRLLWADILKILAIFGVILLHVSAPMLVPFSPTREWWIGNIYDSLTRWCVPLFVMVSGAMILPNVAERPLRHFFLHQVRKILVPFLIWSAIYFLYRMQVKEQPLALSDFLRTLLTQPIYYHLWFIYMLIVLYLLAPAISVFLNRAPAKHAWYLITLWFFWASLLPVIDRPLDLESYFTPDMDDYSALRLSGYFLLGYMLKDRRARSTFQLFIVGLFFLTGGSVTIFGTYLMSLNRGEFHPFFYKYFSITVVAMTISLFVFVNSVFNTRQELTVNGEKRIRMESPILIQIIGLSVFGVYLIHALVLEVLRDGRLGFIIDHTSIFGIELPLAAGLPVFAFSIFSISLCSVMIIRLIPPLRDVVA